jgi:excinuclease UvrABC nuclease subunit
MGHCAAPCNLSVGEDKYNDQARRAISFLRGRSGPILGELARARDQAAASMRFEEAQRHHRSLEALATLAERATRLSRVLTENNLVIVMKGAEPITGASAANDTSQPISSPLAYVVLSGRLALIRELDSVQAAGEVARFIADHYELYKLRPVLRTELESMSIVARWLKERTPDDGKLIWLDGPALDPRLLA